MTIKFRRDGRETAPYHSSLSLKKLPFITASRFDPGASEMHYKFMICAPNYKISQVQKLIGTSEPVLRGHYSHSNRLIRCTHRAMEALRWLSLSRYRCIESVCRSVGTLKGGTH